MKLRTMLGALMLALSAAMASAQMPGPSDEIKKLDWMLGEWTGSVKWNLPEMPEMTAAMTVKTDWDGNFLRSTSSSDMGGMAITESCYIGWDPGAKRYTMWTFTNFGQMPRIEHGNLDGDKLVTVSEPWDVGMPGGPTVSRVAMHKKSATEMTFILEFKNGDKWDKVGEGSFSKKA